MRHLVGRGIPAWCLRRVAVIEDCRAKRQTATTAFRLPKDSVVRAPRGFPETRRAGTKAGGLGGDARRAADRHDCSLASDERVVRAPRGSPSGCCGVNRCADASDAHRQPGGSRRSVPRWVDIDRARPATRPPDRQPVSLGAAEVVIARPVLSAEEGTAKHIVIGDPGENAQTPPIPASPRQPPRRPPSSRVPCGTGSTHGVPLKRAGQDRPDPARRTESVPAGSATLLLVSEYTSRIAEEPRCLLSQNWPAAG